MALEPTNNNSKADLWAHWKRFIPYWCVPILAILNSYKMLPFGDPGLMVWEITAFIIGPGSLWMTGRYRVRQMLFFFIAIPTFILLFLAIIFSQYEIWNK